MRYQRQANLSEYRSHRGPRLLADLARLGMDLPDEVADAKARLDTLQARLKAEPTDVDRREAALAALEADPSADVADHADAELRADTIRNVLLQAADQQRRRLTAALTTHADTMVQTIRAGIFDPAVKVLTDAAKAGPTDTPGSLLRAGQDKTARALADAPSAYENVQLAYQLRASLYPRSDIDAMACAHWKTTPTDLDELEGLDRFLAGIRNGHTPWFGTYSEVDRASRKHRSEQDAATKAAIDAQVHQWESTRKARRRPTPQDAA